jgi:hypothetical protein
MDLPDSLKTILIETAKSLRGSQRRLFMARTVGSLGPGGQSWNRATIRKGLRELRSGITTENRSKTRGRRRTEERLPHLLADIQEIVNAFVVRTPGTPLSLTKPAVRLTAEELRRQLVLRKGYSDADLPAARTLRNKLRDLGLKLGGTSHRKLKRRSHASSPYCRRVPEAGIEESSNGS